MRGWPDLFWHLNVITKTPHPVPLPFEKGEREQFLDDIWQICPRRAVPYAAASGASSDMATAVLPGALA